MYPRWTSIYGSHRKSSKEEIAAKMNEFPEVASSFKGEVLLSIDMIEKEDPILQIQDFDE